MYCQFACAGRKILEKEKGAWVKEKMMEIVWLVSQSHFHLSFIFIKMNFYYCHSSVMFKIKSMSIYNYSVNYDEIIIQ